MPVPKYFTILYHCVEFICKTFSHCLFLLLVSFSTAALKTILSQVSVKGVRQKFCETFRRNQGQIFRNSAHVPHIFSSPVDIANERGRLRRHVHLAGLQSKTSCSDQDHDDVCIISNFNSAAQWPACLLSSSLPISVYHLGLFEHCIVYHFGNVVGRESA